MKTSHALIDEVLAAAPRFGAVLGAVKKTFPVLNPADGSHLADVHDMGADHAHRAIEAAQRALPAWSARTAKDRAVLLRAWNDSILAHRDELARLITLEQGKPLSEAAGEIVYGASFVEWFAEEGKRLYGDVIPAQAPDKRILVIKQPIGVVGAITPWNFPNAMITRKVAPALAAGCTIVLKPAEDTPLSALALFLLAQRVGLPEGIINIVTAQHAAEVAGVLTTHPEVRKISFTGSTRVGKLLMRQSADTVKKLSLELGGNAPFIVFDDADIDAAVSGAIRSKFRNAGQTCVCANRILVQSSVIEEFTRKFMAATQALVVGDGLQEGTTIGPLINAAALQKVSQLVSQAVEKGARVVLGAAPHARGGNFFQPTILGNVTTDMAIAQAEIFGPVAPIVSFDTEAQAIAMANDTQYGLAAYFYARDVGRIFRVAEQLQFGMVALNDGAISSEAAPFGGVKQSGIGREGSKYGLEEFVEMKFLSLCGI